MKLSTFASEHLFGGKSEEKFGLKNVSKITQIALYGRNLMHIYDEMDLFFQKETKENS